MGRPDQGPTSHPYQAYLTNDWPLPDVSPPGLIRTLSSRAGDHMAVAPDGSWLVTSGQQGPGGHYAHLQILDPHTGRQRHVFRGHKGAVRAVAVAPDGSWIASGSEDGTVRIWDVQSGRQRHVFRGHKGAVRAVAVAPDGSWIASGSKDRTVRIWDVQSGRQRRVLKGDPADVTGVAVAADGSWIATLEESVHIRLDKREMLHRQVHPLVRIWDPRTGKQLHSYSTSSSVLLATESAGEPWLLLADEQRVGLSDPRTGQVLRRGPVGSEEYAEVLSPKFPMRGQHREFVKLAASLNGERVAWWEGAALRIWATNTHEVNQLSLRLPVVDGMAMASDGAWLTTVSRGRVQIWDLQNSAAFQSPSPSSRTRDRWGGRTWRRVNPDVIIVAAAASAFITIESDDIFLRDLTTGQEKLEVAHAMSWGKQAVITANGRWVATLGKEGVAVWGMSRRNIARSNPYTVTKPSQIWHAKDLRVSAMAPDGSWLATIGSGKVQISDPAARQQRRTICHTEGQAIVFAPDRSWFATAFKEKLSVWHYAAGEVLNEFSAAGSVVRMHALQPDMRRLATESDNGALQIWDVGSGEELQALSTGTDGSSPRVALSPDGKWLATLLTESNAIRILDTKRGETATMMRTESNLTCCAWTPDGRRLLVAGYAGLYAFNWHRPCT